jgi:hypothetical protein
MATIKELWAESQRTLFRFLDETNTDKTLPGANERFEHALNELVMAQIALYLRGGWRLGDPIPDLLHDDPGEVCSISLQRSTLLN